MAAVRPGPQWVRPSTTGWRRIQAGCLWPMNGRAGPAPHDHPLSARSRRRTADAKPGRSRVEAAAARVGAAQGRLTEPRRRVLELLLTASRPLKAYDLVERFHPDRRVAMPATVYRALEFLEKMALVHRLATVKSYVACDRDVHVHAAFLICECCGASQEISAPRDDVSGSCRRGAGVRDRPRHPGGPWPMLRLPPDARPTPRGHVSKIIPAKPARARITGGAILLFQT